MAADDGGGGPFFTRRIGGMPLWVWMGLAIAVLLAITMWRKNTAGTETAEPTLPDEQQPMYTFIEGADTNIINVPSTPSPPTSGRPLWPFRTPTVPVKPVAPVTPVTPVTPVAPVAPAAPSGQWVTVVKWAKGQPKGTPSTIWGIAEKFYGSGSNWGKIWNSDQNASLRAKRSNNYRLIQPGDKVWVPL